VLAIYTDRTSSIQKEAACSSQFRSSTHLPSADLIWFGSVILAAAAQVKKGYAAKNIYKGRPKSQASDEVSTDRAKAFHSPIDHLCPGAVFF
jgi:hypothetical protein